MYSIEIPVCSIMSAILYSSYSLKTKGAVYIESSAHYQPTQYSKMRLRRDRHLGLFLYNFLVELTVSNIMKLFLVLILAIIYSVSCFQQSKRFIFSSKLNMALNHEVLQKLTDIKDQYDRLSAVDSPEADQ